MAVTSCAHGLYYLNAGTSERHQVSVLFKMGESYTEVCRIDKTARTLCGMVFALVCGYCMCICVVMESYEWGWGWVRMCLWQQCSDTKRKETLNNIKKRNFWKVEGRFLFRHSISYKEGFYFKSALAWSIPIRLHYVLAFVQKYKSAELTIIHCFMIHRIIHYRNLVTIFKGICTTFSSITML